MRLTVPDPDITLYEDGFAHHDQLDRKATGDKLSDLVERIDDPLVIALDGAWGSGKSFFLKCWVGEHLQRKGNSTQTVYFDAFKHDYLDDPLIALTGAIAERFTTAGAEESDAKTRKIKKAAWAIGKGAARIGLSAVTFGATEILGDMGDEIAKATGAEAKAFLNSEKGNEEANDYWDMQRSKIAAMSAFRLALTGLTEPETEGANKGKPSRKLVIVIDELDRCRPDYALSLLEIIKHFFNVDGVHFVLGCNTEALAWTVRSRYGENYDARRYLQRFINLKLRLAQNENLGFTKHPVDDYFLSAVEQMGLTESQYLPSLKSYISAMKYTQGFSIRDLHQLLARLAITSPPHDLDNFDRAIISGLLVLEAFAPDAISKVRNLDGKMFEITGPLELHDPLDSEDAQGQINWASWWACYSDINDDRFRSVVGQDIDGFGNGYDRNRVLRLLEQHIDLFELN